MNEREYIAALSEFPVSREQLLTFVHENRRPNDSSLGSAGRVYLHRIRFELMGADPVVCLEAAVRMRALATINIPKDLRRAFGSEDEFWEAVATAPLLFENGCVVLQEGALKNAIKGSEAPN
jgi:hypothetical protein